MLTAFRIDYNQTFAILNLYMPICVNIFNK